MSQYKNYHWSKKISGLKKLIICIVITIITYFLLSIFKFDSIDRIVLAWDTFCISMLVFGWALFFSTEAKELCHIVEKQDDGLKIIFAITLVAISLSVFGTLILLTGKNGSEVSTPFHTIVLLSPVFLSWLLLHTTFTIRYAHLYHDHNKLHTGSNIGGIEFPTKDRPDYIDFAYFSFVIGMTFQVSDITVSSRAIRRFVLMHSLISFIFNTIIVALTINTIAGLNN